MKDRATPMTRRCEGCGAGLDGLPAMQRFCSRSCYKQWWVTHRQGDFAARGIDKLAALRAAGQDPRSVGEIAQRRSAKIAESNRLNPRRGKRADAPDAAKDPRPRLHAVPTAMANAETESEMDDEVAWAERGAYWQCTAEPPPTQRSTTGRRAEPAPLVVTGHGVCFRIEQGALVVRNGFTHHPHARQEWRLFPGDRRLPSRIVVLDGDGSLSFDVVAWLSRQQIPLLVLDWQGEIVALLGDGAAPDARLRAAQVAASTNGVGLRLATRLIQAKVVSSLETLRSLPPSLSRDRGVRKVDGALNELERQPPATVEGLRLLEGRAALAYFTCWQAIPLRWKGTGRTPIPDDWTRIGLRQSLLSGTNRHATHPVNAILNYAYGVLEGQVRIAAVAAGLDPTLGYLHACRPGRAALVYDLMEPLRPRVDRLVIDFFRGRTFATGDMQLTERGICRLHPQLAQTVAKMGAGDSLVTEIVASAARDIVGA